MCPWKAGTVSALRSAHSAPRQAGEAGSFAHSLGALSLGKAGAGAGGLCAAALPAQPARAPPYWASRCTDRPAGVRGTAPHATFRRVGGETAATPAEHGLYLMDVGAPVLGWGGVWPGGLERGPSPPSGGAAGRRVRAAVTHLAEGELAASRSCPACSGQHLP